MSDDLKRDALAYHAVEPAGKLQILPTKPMRRWLSDPATDLKPQSRAKFYVALTRGRYSVAIAMDWGAAPLPTGFSLYARPP